MLKVSFTSLFFASIFAGSLCFLSPARGDDAQPEQIKAKALLFDGSGVDGAPEGQRAPAAGAGAGGGAGADDLPYPDEEIKNSDQAPATNKNMPVDQD